MVYRVLADVVVVAHLAFIAFALLGGFAALRWRWLVWLHVPAAIWGAAVEFSGWLCPLTPLENSLRRMSGSAGYPGGFVDHYLIPIIYPQGLTREIQLLLGAVVVVINLIAYFLLWQSRRSAQPQADDPKPET